MIPLSYSFRNLWIRRMTTLLTAGGMALVVFVFSAVLMLANGLEKTLVSTGSDQNAIILRKGSDSEVQSMITRDQVNILKSQPEISTGPDGKALVTGEVLVLINLPKRATNRPSNVELRGVLPESIPLRSQVKLIKGRFWQPGSSEIIVGTSVAKRFQGIGLGESIHVAMRDWTVVGLFESGGAAFESEIWIDAEQLMQAFKRTIFSSVTLQLKNPNDFSSLKTRLEADPRLTVTAEREKEYYTKQSKVLAMFIRILGIFVTVIFSLGATIGAMITMYASVSNRTVEIGTLRALGFRRRHILTAFLMESLFLSLVGGGAGLFFASFLQTLTVSTTNFATFSEIAFSFSLSPSIFLASFLFTLMMGFAGGVLPAVQAARRNIVQALRST
ncbi:MAG: ABC transporter permease [Nitrospirae bacterium]|nr:ABC transporter permease [Nitrospirota bacterium]MBI3351559.1 ABC transporter permease [Nitrospirota bacterium]